MQRRRSGPAISRTITSASMPTIGAEDALCPRRMIDTKSIQSLLAHAEAVLSRVEAALPAALTPPDWKATAYRWRKRAGRGFLQPIAHPHAIRLDDLVAIDEQKRTIDRNTR